ncbi:MAG: sigma-54-dependent Fis family transcriptional regulator [Myxococcota bacterium]
MKRLSLLVDLSSLITKEVGIDALLDLAGRQLAEAMNAARATLWLVNSEDGSLVTGVAVLPEAPSLTLARGQGIAGHVALSGETVRVDDARTDARFDRSVDATTGFATRSVLAAPVRAGKSAPVRGVVQVLNKAGGPFDEEDARYLEALAVQLDSILDLTSLRARDASAPGVVLRGPINRIIGRSPSMKAVYERLMLAAETDATVLFRGETGTGKTLLSRAVHANSARSTGPFVTVDCTTLPGALAASELFGHERGAFTGADRRVRGKVEMAHGGTLFLDEIAELPADSQALLLRFIQDRAFERVGGRETLHADVRLCCATHVDLEDAVAKGRFREDLYYRIRVVEIDVPPLRARGAAEICELAEHFAEGFAKRYGRPKPRFTADALEAMRRHEWPGNVRELQHFVESAVVLARDGVIDAAPPQRMGAANAGVWIPYGLSLEEATRRYVHASVQRAAGVRARAAEQLRVGRNTVTRILKRGEDSSD